MTLYPGVTKEDMIELAKISEQQENQGLNKIQKRILKPTHNGNLAETVKPITFILEKNY